MALKNENHDDLKLFRNRIWKLMEKEKLDTQEALAEQLALSGYVAPGSRLPKDEYYSEEDIFKRKVGAITKHVQKHLNSDTAECLSGEYAMAYSKLFGCSYDYLYGMDTCTTKTNQFIHDETGLTDEAITSLAQKNEDNLILLNYLLENNCMDELNSIFTFYLRGYPFVKNMSQDDLHYMQELNFEKNILNLFHKLGNDEQIRHHFSFKAGAIDILEIMSKLEKIKNDSVNSLPENPTQNDIYKVVEELKAAAADGLKSVINWIE